MNIAVYLGSSFGNDPSFKEAAYELGRWIGEKGHVLVYGGSKRGLMGVLAGAVHDEGGKVIGVEPKFFMKDEIVSNILDELYVTEDISDRKKKMIELSDAFICFPGGTGTLEEIAEVMSMNALKLRNAPCILYDLHGYYQPLKQQLNLMVERGFSTEEKLEPIAFVTSLKQIAAIIEKAQNK
ncbi:MAG: TIGR00730 family Rossman fold protein [Erysipelotrichaceae bacterium]|nr:TIGR00730 family Rossman fold protein [Erysipelotrichaceae bacterium]